MNDQEQPYAGEYTDGLRRLNEALHLDPDNLKYELIERQLYKYTECGAWISFSDEGIRLGSIVEGCDFGSAVYPLKWADVNRESLYARIEAIENEVEALWDWANETDRECDPPDVWRDYTRLGQDGFSS